MRKYAVYPCPPEGEKTKAKRRKDEGEKTKRRNGTNQPPYFTVLLLWYSEIICKGIGVALKMYVGWLVLLRIYVALIAVFQPYRDLKAGDNQSLKIKWRERESNPGPLAPQAKSLTTRPPPLPLYNNN